MLGRKEVIVRSDDDKESAGMRKRLLGDNVRRDDWVPELVCFKSKDFVNM